MVMLKHKMATLALPPHGGSRTLGPLSDRGAHGGGQRAALSELHRVRSKPTSLLERREPSPSSGSARQTPTFANGEDPLRKLAPARKKLATVEAQRILGSTDEAVRRMESALVLPFLSASLERFSVSLGAELVAMIEDHRQLSNEYSRLHEALEAEGTTLRDEDSEMADSCSSLGREGSSARLRTERLKKPGQLEPLLRPEMSAEEQYSLVRHQMKHCTRNILREMARNPSTPSVLQAAAREKSHGAAKLLESVGALREVVRERLLTTRAEETQREGLLVEVAKRRREAEERIENLEAELAKAQQRKSDEVTLWRYLILCMRGAYPNNDSRDVYMYIGDTLPCMCDFKVSNYYW